MNALALKYAVPCIVLFGILGSSCGGDSQTVSGHQGSAESSKHSLTSLTFYDTDECTDNYVLPIIKNDIESSYGSSVTRILEKEVAVDGEGRRFYWAVFELYAYNHPIYTFTRFYDPTVSAGDFIEVNGELVPESANKTIEQSCKSNDCDCQGGTDEDDNFDCWCYDNSVTGTCWPEAKVLEDNSWHDNCSTN